MSETVSVDICVIGAGAGGLSVAAGASQMGASVALVEKHLMGGDCLNYGCIPSKALLAAAHAAASMRGAGRFGIAAAVPEIDASGVYDHVRAVIDAIAPMDSKARFEGLGVRVILAPARFTGPAEVAAGGYRIRARRFVVASGSAPALPPVSGLAQVPYLTNETLFGLRAVPEHLLVLGGGPIGVELAQAHRRLGARVTLLEMACILAKDDPELVDVVRRRLTAEGVEILQGAAVTQVEKTGLGVAAVVEIDGQRRRVEGSHLLVAAGRAANVEDLGLDAAGIEFGPGGIAVDAKLKTSNRRVFAIGDCTGGLQFTHVAGYHAGIVIRQALFGMFWVKADARAVPWVTYSDPELAQVGLTEAQARQAGHPIRLLRWPFAENDRALAEADSDGLIKVVTTPKGRILGAGIAGAGAGELIQPWVLAMANNLKIGAMAQYIAPYPTRGEISKRAAGSFFTSSLFSERTRRLVRFLARFGRP